MAENKVLKGINFPGLEGTYYIPEAVAIEDDNGFVEIQSYISDSAGIENLDTTLTKNGMAAEAKATGEAINKKLEISTIKESAEIIIGEGLPSGNYVANLCYGNGAFYALAHNGCIYSSVDGAHWSLWDDYLST